MDATEIAPPEPSVIVVGMAIAHYLKRLRALSEMPHMQFNAPKPGSGLPHLGIVDFRVERYPELTPIQKQTLIRAFSNSGVLGLYHGGGVGGNRWLYFTDGAGGKEEVAVATPAQISDPTIPRLPADWEKYMVHYDDQEEASHSVLYHEIARLRELLEKNFHDQYHVKNKIIDLKIVDLEHDPELVKELFDLITTAYSGIGGHLGIRQPHDLLNGELTVFRAADIDADPQADVFFYGKKTPFGMKYAGMGHDGSSHAKMYALEKTGELLHQAGVYAEVSGALGHILLTRYRVPVITDQKRVEHVLGKKVKWIGAHPDGKYPGQNGWYVRSVGGMGEHMKILVGVPH